MNPELVLFAAFGLVAVVSAFAVILHPHPVYSALALVVTLFQIAALFVLLDAHMIAFLQVLVYAGAIMVLFLFVIMLLNLQREAPEGTTAWRVGVLALGGVFATELGSLFLFRVMPPGGGDVAGDYGSVLALGRSLFGRHALSFEVTSILLLVAVVGSVVIARKGSQ